jgi:hypothetical protein
VIKAEPQKRRRPLSAPWLRQAAAASALSVLVAVAGCGQGSTAAPAAPADSTAAAPAVASRIDPRWMGFDTSAPWNWEEISRELAPSYQTFGFRSLGEVGNIASCPHNCGEKDPTVYVRVYAPGTSSFDPTDARTGQPVDVNGRDGFFRAETWNTPARDGQNLNDLDAMLTWQYADNAWATVQGASTTTSGLDRLLELARALRPDERTPARAPLSLANLPVGMQLASVYQNFVPMSAGAGYGTELRFAPCEFPKAEDCTRDDDERIGSLTVQIWHRDDYTDEDDRVEVDRQIGGKNGRYDSLEFWAGVLPEKGLYVEFDVIPPSNPLPTAKERDALTSQFERTLDSVTWAPDPGNESAWPPVTEWVK